MSTEAIVDRLFQRLAGAYGKQWLDQWTGVPMREVKAAWSDGLRELTAQEVADGLNALMRAGRPFPPTLPEFFGLCRRPIDVPPITDHKALDALAAKLGGTTVGCDSYYALRQRLVEHLARPQPARIGDAT